MVGGEENGGVEADGLLCLVLEQFSIFVKFVTPTASNAAASTVQTHPFVEMLAEKVFPVLDALASRFTSTP